MARIVNNMTIKIGNVPDEKVRQTMELLRDEVFPAVRHLGVNEEAVAAE